MIVNAEGGDPVTLRISPPLALLEDADELRVAFSPRANLFPVEVLNETALKVAAPRAPNLVSTEAGQIHLVDLRSGGPNDAHRIPGPEL
eukprot:3473373-Prorocentrum_lima.AAC.1